MNTVRLLPAITCLTLILGAPVHGSPIDKGPIGNGPPVGDYLVGLGGQFTASELLIDFEITVPGLTGHFAYDDSYLSPGPVEHAVVAWHLDLTNTSATMPYGFFASITFPLPVPLDTVPASQSATDPVLVALSSSESATFTGFVEAALFDANGDGSAFAGGFVVGFRFLNDTPPFAAPEFFTLATPGTETIYDYTVPIPASPVGDLNFLYNGFFGPLSPGDRLVLDVYGCVALSSTICPAPPDLSAPPSAAAPEPATWWLLAAGLLGLAGSRLRRAR